MMCILLATVLFVSGVSAGCQSGWVPHGESCYHLSHDKETWFDAEIVCKVFGGFLAEINSATENNFITSLLMNGNKVNGAWIGASDLIIEGEWIWTHTRELITYNSWSPNEPNNSGNDENCGLSYTNGVWNDGTCRGLLHYVCEEPMSDGGSVIG